MSDSFPRVSFWRHGYATERVDAFFADARQAYEGGLPAEQFSAQQVRQATFPLKRRGYAIDAVDSAMSRLEAAFVQRDRADHIAVNGEAAWFEKVAERATTLYDRLMRPRASVSHTRNPVVDMTRLRLMICWIVWPPILTRALR